MTTTRRFRATVACLRSVRPEKNCRLGVSEIELPYLKDPGGVFRPRYLSLELYLFLFRSRPSSPELPPMFSWPQKNEIFTPNPDATVPSKTLKNRPFRGL